MLRMMGAQSDEQAFKYSKAHDTKRLVAAFILSPSHYSHQDMENRKHTHILFI